MNDNIPTPHAFRRMQHAPGLPTGIVKLDRPLNFTVEAVLAERLELDKAKAHVEMAAEANTRLAAEVSRLRAALDFQQGKCKGLTFELAVLRSTIDAGKSGRLQQELDKANNMVDQLKGDNARQARTIEQEQHRNRVLNVLQADCVGLRNDVLKRDKEIKSKDDLITRLSEEIMRLTEALKPGPMKWVPTESNEAKAVNVMADLRKQLDVAGDFVTRAKRVVEYDAGVNEQKRKPTGADYRNIRDIIIGHAI